MTDGIKAGFHRPKKVMMVLSFVLMAAMLAISVFVYGAPAGQLAVLAVFFVFYVQFPGALIVKWMGFEECGLSARIALGCFLGWAVNVLLVYIFSMLHVVFPLYAIGPLMAIMFLIKLVSEKREKGSEILQRPDFDGIAVFSIFLCMALFFCLLGTQYQYLMPPRGEAAFIVGDKAYHMGLMNAVSHGFPFESPWVKGHIIQYHMFTDIMLSVPISLFGIRADVIGQSFAPLLTVYCVGISFYAFFREMSSKPERVGLYCLIFFLSGMYITRRWSSFSPYSSCPSSWDTPENCSWYSVEGSPMNPSGC